MNKYILYFGIVGCMGLINSACSDSEGDLLEPKVYFENKEYTIDVEDDTQTMTFDLAARLSTMTSSQVNVSYSIADASVVESYNQQYGTEYRMFDPSNVELSSTTSVIPEGKLYADNVQMKITNLDVLEEGKPFILPVRVNSSTETLPGTSVAYFLINKPVKIKKAGKFNDSHISIRFPAGTFFKSFTYEALVYLRSMSSNITVMGTEGIMILRIGDSPATPTGCLEVAGQQHYNVTEPLKVGKWYHVALTYDQSSGKTALYVNGEKKAGSDWSIPGFKPNDDQGFSIGKVPGFPWGERPLTGNMSEIRVWSVARTANQLKQNMFTVDPKSDGLELYYKLNGSEEIKSDKIIDSTGKNEGTAVRLTIEDLDVPIAIE